MVSAGMSGRILVSYFSPPKRLEKPGKLSTAEHPARPTPSPRTALATSRDTNPERRMDSDAAFGAVKSSCIRRNSSNGGKRGLAIKWERTSLSRLDSRLLRSSRRDVGYELWRSRARLEEPCEFFSGLRPECHTGPA